MNDIKGLIMSNETKKGSNESKVNKITPSMFTDGYARRITTFYDKKEEVKFKFASLDDYVEQTISAEGFIEVVDEITKGKGFSYTLAEPYHSEVNGKVLDKPHVVLVINRINAENKVFIEIHQSKNGKTSITTKTPPNHIGYITIDKDLIDAHYLALTSDLKYTKDKRNYKEDMRFGEICGH